MRFYRDYAANLSAAGVLLASGSVAVAQPSEPPNDPRPSAVAHPAQTDTALGDAPAKTWRPSDPLRLGQGNAYVDLGIIGTMAAGGSTAADIENGTQSGGHDPYQRGFNLQGLELNLTGAVDPYFRANVNMLYSLDAAGESLFEVEEAWAESVALPGNLQVRAGQIYTAFGRHNSTHLHAWSFVDTPLVNGRFLGADGLRNPGARLAWLTPTPFYSELMLGIQNSHGAHAASFRSEGHSHDTTARSEDELPLAYRHADNDRGLVHGSDLLFSPRYALSFDINDRQTVLIGASGAFGPNSRGGEGSGETTTQIYGVDLTWKWRSARHHGGFPFVQWQTEGLLRQYDAGAFQWDEDGDGAVSPGEIEDLDTGLPALLGGETLTDYGFYTQVLYGFRKAWVVGLRFDWVDGRTGDYENRNLAIDGNRLSADPERAARRRLSPNLTWYPSDFSKLRLQYNWDDRDQFGTDHSVWLQFEFLLGAHAAHTF